ncbi:class I SAM-dependent methyltransferase [Candidatus Omnitrophota bacterium]
MAKVKMIERPSCPVCESLDSSVFFSGMIKETRLRSPRRILKCRSCSQLFVNPVPSVEEIDDYHLQNKGIPARDRQEAHKKIKKWNSSWRKFILREYLGYGRGPAVNPLKYLCGWFLSRFTRLELLPFQGEGKILDVGCNTGMYLYLLKNLGWQTWGIEIDRNCCEAAGELALDVLCGRIEESDFPPAFFDVVRFHNVLEHMPDPKQALKKAKQFLKKGGRIYISIPNTRSLAAYLSKENWLALGHIQGFFPRSIARLCRDVGFTVKTMRFNSSRDRVLQAIGHMLKLKKDSPFLKNKFVLCVFAPPLRFLLNITGLSDTFLLVLEK